VDDEIGLLVAAAEEAAERGDIGIGLVRAISALALSLRDFVAAVAPKESP